MQVITDQEKIDRNAWRDFVYNHPAGSAFQLPEMYDACNRTEKYEPVFIAVLEGSSILALVLAIIQREHRGVAGYLSSRAIVNYGPLCTSSSNEATELLLKEFDRIVKGRVIYSQFRTGNSQIGLNSVFTNLGFRKKEHLTIILDLNCSEEDLYNGLSRSRKKGIRKARASDLIFNLETSESSIDEFYRILSVTYRRIGLPFPEKRHFSEIASTFNTKGYGIFIIRKGDLVLTALFVLIYRETMYGYYMGTVQDPGLLQLKPVDLLFWEVFRWAQNNNIKYFDWMGAGVPGKSYGVRDFKIQYGGKIESFTRYEKIYNQVLFRFGKTALAFRKMIKRA